jgi:hypothetical protein
VSIKFIKKQHFCAPKQRLKYHNFVSFFLHRTADNDPDKHSVASLQLALTMRNCLFIDVKTLSTFDIERGGNEETKTTLMGGLLG